jgi:hypothetical protein
MANITRTRGREGGTGQDTPLGVCPCPAPLPATPAGHGVTLSRPVPLSRIGALNWHPRLLAGTPMVPPSLLAFDVSNPHQEAV